MRLVNFGPGEVADRLTILSLKIAYGKQASKPVEHFENEREILLAQLPQITQAWFEPALELAAVNAFIWQDTDRVRFLRADYDLGGLDHAAVQELANLAMRLQAMNDRRAILITLINANTGRTEQGAEKG